MRLSSRLLLLILVCLVPVMGAQVLGQINLHRQRQAQLSDVAMRQAELVNGDLASMVDGVRQLAVAVAQFPELHGASAECSQRLAALQRSLTGYRFVAVYDATGRPLCGSAPALMTAEAADRVAVPPADAPLSIGRYGSFPAADGGFLPIIVRLPQDKAAPTGPAALVLALDLQAVADHLQSVTVAHTASLANSVLFLADRDGTVIGRFPPAPQWLGHKLPPEMLPLVTASLPIAQRLIDSEGQSRLAAVVPATVPPAGLTVVESLSLPDLTSDLTQAILRDTLVLALSILLAVGLAWSTVRRFVQRPTKDLLAAAQQWRNGDLAARAEIADPQSEFGTLAQSLNAMAISLQERDEHRQAATSTLEEQVAERTRALSASNNRLQVEIAEREKTEAALHQAQKLQAVGQLSGGIAHDFNNMLATILGSLELMERRVAQSAKAWTQADIERLSKLIERATGAVQRGAQLTSRLLAFSRRQRLSARPTDLNQLINDLVTLATPTLGRRIRVVTDLADDLWAALVDPSQVEAALLNLCLNARDAMPEGGQLTIATSNELVDPRTDPDGLPPGAYVRVSVADTGSGMPPDVLRRAFEPFFTTKGAAGSGLGLNQVNTLVRQSGGSVRIESAPGEGTQVSLLLPRSSAIADAGPSARPAGEPKRNFPSSLVLVVDDDNAVRQVTVEMLKDLGCDTAQAAGGNEALALLDELHHTPDIVLLDYAMPGMNGLQLARALREVGIAAPMALVTGYAELADSDGASSILDALLRKPFTIRELDATLARLRRRVRTDAKAVRMRTS